VMLLMNSADLIIIVLPRKKVVRRLLVLYLI
jgi:hypothetical protein